MKITILLILFFNCFKGLCHKSNIETKEVLLKLKNSDPELEEYRQGHYLFEKKYFEGLGSFLPSLDAKIYQSKYYFTDEEQSEWARHAQLSLSFSFFNFGRDWFDYKKKYYEMKSSHSLLKSKEVEREIWFFKKIVNVLEAREKISISNEMIKIKKKSLEVAKELYHQGRGSEEDVFRVEIEKNFSEESLSEIIFALHESESVLKKYEQSISLEKLSWPWDESLAKIVEGLKMSLKGGETLRNLPQLRIIDEMNQVASNEYHRERTSYLPKFSLGVAKDWEKGGRGNTSVTLSMTYNLFNGFRDYTRTESVLTNKIVVQAKGELNKKEILLSFDTRFRGLSKAFNQYLKVKKYNRISKTLYYRSEGLFQSGKLGMSELLQDQERYLQAKERFLAVKKALYNELLDSMQVLNISPQKYLI